MFSLRPHCQEYTYTFQDYNMLRKTAAMYCYLSKVKDLLCLFYWQYGTDFDIFLKDLKKKRVKKRKEKRKKETGKYPTVGKLVSYFPTTGLMFWWQANQAWKILKRWLCKYLVCENISLLSMPANLDIYCTFHPTQLPTSHILFRDIAVAKSSSQQLFFLTMLLT